MNEYDRMLAMVLVFNLIAEQVIKGVATIGEMIAASEGLTPEQQADISARLDQTLAKYDAAVAEAKAAGGTPAPPP